MNDVMSRLDLIGKTFFSKWEDFLPNNTLVIQHQNNSIILNIDFSICLDFNHTVLTYYIVNLLKKPIYLWQYTTSISAANSAATQLYGVPVWGKYITSEGITAPPMTAESETHLGMRCGGANGDLKSARTKSPAFSLHLRPSSVMPLQ